MLFDSRARVVKKSDKKNSLRFEIRGNPLSSLQSLSSLPRASMVHAHGWSPIPATSVGSVPVLLRRRCHRGKKKAESNMLAHQVYRRGPPSWCRRRAGGSEGGTHMVSLRALSPLPRQRRPVGTWASASASEATPRVKKSKASKLLASLLSLSNLPLTSYVPFPKTALHRIHPSVKLAYILLFLVLIAKTSSIAAKLSIATFFILVQVATFPPRLWKPQVMRTLAVSGLVLFFTACGSDGVPPVLSGGRAVEALSPSTLSLGDLSISNAPKYSYTLVNLGIMSITKRSWALATTLFSLTSMTLTTASITLLTTPPERLAMSLKHLLSPLRVLGVQTHTLFLMTVVSLRFMSVVFEEMRHLLLGVASRGIDFGSLGGLGVLNVGIKAGSELFRRLFERSDRVSTAMLARGVRDMTTHRVLVDDGEVWDDDDEDDCGPRRRREGAFDMAGIAANVIAVSLLIAVTSCMMPR